MTYDATEIEMEEIKRIQTESNNPPRTCDFTGKGMWSGYYINDELYLDDDAPNAEALLLKECKAGGYKTTQEAYDDDYYYYTEWEEETAPTAAKLTQDDIDAMAHTTIAIEWSTADVLGRAMEHNRFLTLEQAEEVLAFCDSQHDCNQGITWETIDIWTSYILEQDEKAA